MDNLLSGLIGALLGSVIGGLVTIWATKRMISHEWEKENINSQNKVKAFLNAIHEEVKMIQNMYIPGIGQKIDELTEGKFFNFYSRLKQNYFTIYSTNGHLIGEVKKPEIRESIVKTYAQAKGMIDSLEMNNDLLKEHDELHKVQIARRAEFDATVINLIGFAKILKKDHIELKQNLQKLIDLLES